MGTDQGVGAVGLRQIDKAWLELFAQNQSEAGGGQNSRRHKLWPVFVTDWRDEKLKGDDLVRVSLTGNHV
jgi:hypothetical protein